MSVQAPSFENLLPELLLALVGHVGGAFVQKNESNDLGDATGSFRLVPEVDWVSQAEREQLDKLARLGSFFSTLEAFVLESSKAGTTGPGALYRAALAHGFSELLDTYRSAILQIEQHILQLETPSLLTLQQFLSDFDVLFPELCSLTYEIRRGGISGPEISSLLALRAHSGVPLIQSCSERLLWNCNQVLFKQLDAWLIHGVLLNKGEEFFIRPFGGIQTPVDWDPLEWHTGFQLSLKDLPPGITLPVAETILFIGKAVRVLQQPMSTAASHQALYAHAEILTFADALRRLQQCDELRQLELEAMVEGMKCRVSSLLWNLVSHKCNLMDHLDSLKNYFLLQRGDFYQQFFDDADTLLRMAPLPGCAADVSVIFSTVAMKLEADMDFLFGKLRLNWAHQSQSKDLPSLHPKLCETLTVPAFDDWDGLFLETTVEWPLQLLFPPEILRKYGALWQFLFRLRRLNLKLEKAWASLRTFREVQREDSQAAALIARLWQQRQRMAHFLANLDMYCHTDVIGSAFSLLRDRVTAAKDFTEAEEAHVVYINSLTSQVFLDMKQMAAILQSMFELCQRLCTLVESISLEEADIREYAKSVAGISREFTIKQNVLFQLMQSKKLQSAERAPALRQFILRLNFNNFAERQALEQINATK